MKKVNKTKGFTLIEILVVIGIIAILATIVIIAINPSRQFAQARNTQRLSNINTILNAIGQNIADNKGVFTCATFGGASGTTTITSGTTGTLLADLSCLVPTYISSGIPADPNGGSSSNTGYTMSTTTTGRFIICADKAAENSLPGSTSLCVTR